MLGKSTVFNLKGFIIGNGMTDMYIDSDNPLLESLANWGMIPFPTWKRAKELRCLFLWEKVPIEPNNDPECADLYNYSMDLIKDLDIYDLYRTVYTLNTEASSLKQEPELSYELYLNRKDVREALHIPDYVQTFLDCNDDFEDNYQVQREGSIWIYRIFMLYGYKMLHYSGDTDGAVATLGTRRWIQRENWPITAEWRPWTTDG